ncbi:MAG TPA: methyltransferase domain-containing protein, partial [Pirellulaceae bacterium]|nr:methyltransferase domain-containing protein [Pirellulaceae bacterium]
GPRPQVPDYVARYSDEEKEVLLVRPGITDWASIWNSDEGAVLARYPDPDKAYDELIHPTKMQLQLKYARECSFVGDLKILASTFICLFRRGWIPAEIRAYPAPGQTASQVEQGFASVTETPGTPINQEQLAMLHTRYAWAGEFADGKDVLEVACGSGIGLGHLATRARSVVGGDYDPRLAEIARRTYTDRIAVSTMDAQSLPFDDATFDVVLLFEAIYYLTQPEVFFAEAHRVLRPGGSVLICSANCERRDFNVSPFSSRYFSARELSELLLQSGFRTEVYAGFPLIPGGLTDRIRDSVRAVAVKLHLVPKTMRWKARIKRLFFGKLEEMPAELGKELPRAESLLRVDASQPISDFKVLYAVGTREAVQQRLAA